MLWESLVILLFVLCYHTDAACENVLNDKRTMTIKVGRKRMSYGSCKDLVNDHPIICKKAVGKPNGQCCKECKDRKADLKCVDDTLTMYGPNSCEKVVMADPCQCMDRSSTLRKDCCDSCSMYGEDCPKCRDTLSESNAITWDKPDGTVVEITDCQDLVDNYLSLCKQQGKEGAKCCQSCSMQGLSCVDSSRRYFPVGDKFLSCAEYVAADPCRCKKMNVKNVCCASCQEAECPCEDSGSWITKVKMGKETCEACTCAMLKDKGDDWLTKVCKRSRARKECCKSCTDLGFPPK